ncbi:MAG: hypothetical protein U0K57_04150 [Lachnospiraceae bacterium]|nr:hypothetical protein [Lachnospiraceae bacterium]
MNITDLKALVKEKGYGTALYGNVNGEPVYLSRGIREVFFVDDNISRIINVVGRFEKGDYGTAAEFGKVPSPGHEYGRYAEISDLTVDTHDDPAVWIHKDGDAIIVYFKFER